MGLPETVKISRQELVSVTTKVGTPFPMNLGPNEVIVLLSFYWNIIGSMNAGVNIGYMGLWRKTDSNPPAMVTGHTDMIWSIRVQNYFTTESVISSWNEHVILPWPLVLIRPPRLIGLATVMTGVSMEMRLFHIIQEVTDEELAKLMVKDHA